MDLNALGVVGPAVQTSLNAKIAALEDLHIQGVLDLSILADQGVAVEAYKAALDGLAQRISLLKADIMTMDDSPKLLSEWQERADALNKDLRAVLAKTGGARQGAPELAALRGLGWAVGVGAVAVLAGVFVWRNRAKARRRRR